ncbi:MAG: hypothetical protein M1835_003556 [Candelina submexicana]|nr:MAG: hypothetical protein M1835_003556 [Candelina submexicana]
MTTTTDSTPSYPTTPYTPRCTSWPYFPRDFVRSDESSDSDFYSAPRFVTHIDDNAISLLGKYYAQVLPRRGRILDFCSSWISHYPKETEEAVDKGDLEVVGLGMNDAELRKNGILKGGRFLQDLNTTPSIPSEVGDLDAATCVVSIDYLTQPVSVLSSLRSRMRAGGKVHLVISNRCFPTKVVGRWLKISEQERLRMVGDYLWFAGWRNVEVVELCDGKADGGGGGLTSWFAFRRNDPLWVVRGEHTGEKVNGEDQMLPR